MGKRGPKPKGQLRPVEVGTRRAERPKPLPGMSPRARAEWRRIVNSLPSDHFKTGDLHLLRAFCEAYDRHVKAQKAVEKDGEYVPTPQGSIKAHPAIAVMTAAAGTMASLAVKLGLSRSARRGADKDEEKKPATPPKRKLFNG